MKDELRHMGNDNQRPGPSDRRVHLRPYVPPAPRWMRVAGLVALAALSLFSLAYGFFYALTAPYLILAFATPIGLLALITIWALPDREHAPTRAMVGCFFGFFVSLIAWPNYLAIALPGLPWITMLRLTGIPMALLLLVCVSTSPQFRKQVSDILGVAPPVWKLLAAFVAIQFFTIGLSATPSESLQKFVVAQTNWTAIFFVACYAYSTPGRLKLTANMLWMAAILVCALGLWEGAIKKVPWAGHIPSFLKVDEAQMMLESMYRGRTYRVKTIHSTPLGLAEYLALVSPFMYHFVATGRTLAVRIAAALTLVLFFRVIQLTDSRLGSVGMLVALLLYVLIWGAQRWRQLKGDLLGPFVVLAYPAFFACLIGLTFVSRRLEIMVWGSQATEGSNTARSEQIAMGLPKILHNPIGYGPGRAAETLGWYSGSFLSIDNYLLAIALEYGVIGFFVYFGMLAYMIFVMLRFVLTARYPRDYEYSLVIPIAVALSAFLVIKAVFSQQDNHPLIFLMMGAALATMYRASKPMPADAPSHTV